MDYQPSNLPGEDPQMGTYYSRSLVRAATAGAALVLVAGVLAGVLGSGLVASVGAMAATLGGLGTVAGVLTEVAARRRPAAPTSADRHAGRPTPAGE